MTRPVPGGLAAPGHAADPEPVWQHLDRRMLAVHPVLDLLKLLPLLVLVLVTGGGSDGGYRLVGGVVLAGLVLVSGTLRWFGTRYRISADRVELRTGLLRRHQRSVHRDRIRTTDLTSTLLHRVFGLAVLRIGTGRQEGGEDAELRLDAVGHAEAERLRRLLLEHRPSAPTPPMGTALPSPAAPGAPAADPGVAEGTEVARWHPAWVRFAPLTFSALAVVGAVVAAGFRVVDEFGLGLADARALRPLGELGVVLGGLLGAVGLVLVAAVGAAALVTESWWAYRLVRTPDGDLVVRRGLLTRRSLTLAGDRLRGAALDEPLLLRLGRGARPSALSSGLSASGEGEQVGALAPAVPRAEAHRIVAEALGRPADATVAAELRRHPAAATRRRWIRGLVPATVLAAVVLLVGTRTPLVPAAVSVALAAVLLAAGAGLAAARAAALGHALTPTHLVTRQGAMVRRTVVLRREGVLGWRVHQSLMQRRAGLVTLVAVSAAGAGAYEVLDVGVDRAVALVAATTPGLLEPFHAADASASGALIIGGG